MGSSNSTDNTVKIYVKMAQPMQLCGQLAEGTVNVVARGHLPYQLLFLKLECFEFCRKLPSSQGLLEELRSHNFSNHQVIFHNLYELGEFPNGLRMGFYSFPFAIKIPGDLPGSLITPHANIKYVLSTYMATTREMAAMARPGTLPYSSCFLNVTEPSRYVSSQQSLMDAVSPTAFLCCGQGVSQATVTFPTSIARAGQRITVGIQNDNRACKLGIAGTKLSIVNHIFTQSKNGDVRRKSRVVNEKVVTGRIPPKQISQVQAVIDVPQDIPNSTAIGYSVASYYTLEVDTQMETWCCSTPFGPNVSEHIYLRASNPMVQQQPPQQPLPPDWAPQVALRRGFPQPSFANFIVNPKIGAMNRAYPLTSTTF